MRLLQQGGADKDDVTIERCKYQYKLDEYKAFSKKMGLQTQMERVYYDLEGRVAPSKDTYQKWLADIERKKKDDIIKSEIKKVGLRGQINLYPEIPDVTKLSFDEEHINKERHHDVSEEEAKAFIRQAKFSLTKWNGKYINYFSDAGAAYVDSETGRIRTAFKKDQFDPVTRKALEAVNRGRA